MPILPGTQYNQDFDLIGLGLPDGWLVYTGATSSSLGTSASLTTPAGIWNNTTGAFKNFAANDSGLASGALMTDQNSAMDRALGIRQTGSFGDSGASFVFNVDNTLGFQNFGLSFKAQMLSVENRSTTWTIDYRVGNSGNFNLLGTYPDPNTFGSSTLNFSNFGTDINNQSNQVQIRISALLVSIGNGNRDSFGIDDFQLTYSSVPVNNPPVVTLPGTAISYTENASATILNASATVTDIDSPNFNNGSLTARFTTGGSADDRLAVRNEGTGSTQINLDGREIYYGSNKIGNFIGGIGTESLVITLNTNATPESVQALLSNITYANVSENPSVNNRTVEFLINDGNSGISTPVTKTITVARVNDAPLIGTTKVLYDGSIALPTTSTPDSKGWIYNATPGVIRNDSGGITTLNTTANTSFQAGFANITQTLNNLDGYIVSFTAQVLAESHNTSTANKNNDGKDDRAGFSVLVVSSNNTKAIELGFWEDRIWAQEDGTTQKSPSLEPDDSPASNFRNLFTQAEFTSFNTKNTSVLYDLAIKEDTYTLFANGNIILSGKLRNYTAFDKLPASQNPYRRANNIFFGDNTPSAQANFTLAKVAVTTNSALPSITLNEDTSVVIPNLRIDDLDAGSDNISVTLSVSQGKLTINNSVSGGVAAGTISNNSTGNVILTGTLSQINATLANATGLIYLGNLDFNGSDTLNISVNDGFNTANKNLAITVNPVNDRPTFTIGNNQSVKTGLTQTIAGWARDFNSGAANETQSLAGYIVKVVNDVNADIFDIAPTINPAGDLTYKAKSGITASKTATIEVQVQDSGDTLNSGVNTSDPQTFTITVNPTTTNSIYGTPNADILMGTDQSDRISGLDSDDIIYGGLGSDRIFGDNGNDILYGDLGIIFNSDPKLISDVQPVYGGTFSKDDTIAGGLGSDRIYGNLGNDKLYGDDGNDEIWGGEGDDQIWGGYGNDTLYGGTGKDSFVLVRGQGTDTIMDFTTEDVLGCAGALKYSSLSPEVQNGDTLIFDKGTNQLLATLKGFTGTVNYGGLF